METCKYFQQQYRMPSQVTVDCRTLPGQDEEYVLDQVRRALRSDIADDQEHCSLAIK